MLEICSTTEIPFPNDSFSFMNGYCRLTSQVQRQLYFEPQDYDGVRLALEPVFAARKPLRAVGVPVGSAGWRGPLGLVQSNTSKNHETMDVKMLTAAKDHFENFEGYCNLNLRQLGTNVES